MATTTRRRQAARRPARRSARRTARQQRNNLLGVAAVIGLFAIVAAVRWVNAHRGISIAVAAFLLLAGAYWLARSVSARTAAGGRCPRASAPT